jgi:hypothetical protein
MAGEFRQSFAVRHATELNGHTNSGNRDGLTIRGKRAATQRAGDRNFLLSHLLGPIRQFLILNIDGPDFQLAPIGGITSDDA